MDEIKLTLDEILTEMVSLGLIDDEGTPISYNTFKNRASIHRYGWNKVTYIGKPGLSLFAFYAYYSSDLDANVMKDAYNSFLKLVKGNLTEFNLGDVRWKERIPISYDY